MSYTKLPRALVRANRDHINKIRLSPGRLRSTVSSTHTTEKQKATSSEHFAVGKPVEFISQTKNIYAEPCKVEIDFENTKEAYRSKNNFELLRSLLVFKLCTFDIVVDKNKELMDLSKKVLGQRLFEKLMKLTFYGQFVAGEDHQSIKPLIQKNQAFGVGAVLDYSVEEDLTQEEAEKKEME